MTNNKLQSTIDNQNSQYLQSAIPDPDRKANCTQAKTKSSLGQAGSDLNSNIAISVRNLSKKYQLYETPKHRLKEALHPFKKKYHREFWAVRDVSFEARHGETVGIIGRNGSGKSTLLQMICGTLTPTQGEINVNGRVSALLELGSGFNPQFTGKQNVYMNGAIMGFSRQEIDARFEDIASFADIGDFIDQPVRTYSSGMYVRLAFAVAINVDPEILIVDEALAVGDAKFQRKCFAKLEEFRKSGKTILFVSHAMGTINLLCDKAMILDKGRIVELGKPKPITKLYYKMLFDDEKEKHQKKVESKQKTQTDKEKLEKTSEKKKAFSAIKQSPVSKETPLEREKFKQLVLERLKINHVDANPHETRYGDRSKAEIIDFGILDEHGKKTNIVDTGERYTIFFRVLLYEDFYDNTQLNFQICDKKGISIYLTGTAYQNIDISNQKKGSVLEIQYDITMWLAPGDYFLTFGVASESLERYDVRRDVFHFRVADDPRISPSSLVNLNAKMNVKKLLGK